MIGMLLTSNDNLTITSDSSRRPGSCPRVNSVRVEVSPVRSVTILALCFFGCNNYRGSKRL